jgi:hypothetical protein
MTEPARLAVPKNPSEPYQPLGMALQEPSVFNLSFL